MLSLTSHSQSSIDIGQRYTVESPIYRLEQNLLVSGRRPREFSHWFCATDVLNMTPRLNVDVLREICGFLTAVRDVLSLSRTCSTLRIVAVERRLSMRTITINCARSLRALYNFVFVDKERRGPHIRAISTPESISPERLSEDLADLFLAVLASATRLRTLTLYVPGEPSSLFTRHPSVLPAVAHLTSLRELNIAASMDVVNVLLGSTCSALRIFRYQPTYEGNEPSGSLSIHTAPQLASALEEMEVPSDFLVIASRSHASFPAVRSVILTDAEGDEPFQWQMDVLLTLFPNLDRTLVIDAVHVFADGDDGPLATLRRENREAQKTRRAWGGLDRVASASPDVLYALGLACPIRHLTLEHRTVHLAADDPEFQASVNSNSRAVLQECTPTHLALIHDEMSDGFSSLYTSLFLENAVARLTHLVLETGYTSIRRPNLPRRRARDDEEETERSWDAILDSLLSELKSLRRLTHVRITMSAGITYYREPSSPDLIYDGLRSFKFDRLLAALPSALPALSHIFITSSGGVVKVARNVGEVDGEGMKESWKTSRAWRVRSRPRPRDDDDTQPGPPPEGGGPLHALEELTAEEAKAMIGQEELYPTERSYWGVEDEPDMEPDDDRVGDDSPDDNVAVT
ncbi:hypothetical protein LXA43DRAFT_76903 [Ganoderma leucocontextum]|nr:hypothetical protein LXA43DRAFT_76903 [Ganoderma leucocontextum]